MGRGEALEALQRIQAARPEQDIAYLIEQASDALLRDTWDPITPSDLLGFLHRAANRRADTSEQLLEVVVEQLEKLQTRLHGTPALVQFLWNDPRPPHPPTPKDEAALKLLVLDRLRENLRDCIVVREVEV